MEKDVIDVAFYLSKSEQERLAMSAKNEMLIKSCFIRQLLLESRPAYLPPLDWQRTAERLHTLGQTLNDLAHEGNLMCQVDDKTYVAAVQEVTEILRDLERTLAPENTEGSERAARLWAAACAGKKTKCHIRVQWSLKIRWQEDAETCGMTMSRYLRCLINGLQPLQATPPESRQVKRELMAIRNSLEQIAVVGNMFTLPEADNYHTISREYAARAKGIIQSMEREVI